MVDDATLHFALAQPFRESHLSFPERIQGKVRDIYPNIKLNNSDKAHSFLVTTDRLSAFDRVLATVPYKGQVLNQLSAWWFKKTEDIIPNHFVSMPDPNVLCAQQAKPLSIEVIVRGYITGVTSTALWRRYELGERTIYGYSFPEGLKKNGKLPTPIITPTTKAGPGQHDERLTCEEVVSQGWLEEKTWAEIQKLALALFARGQTLAKAGGLLLVDTKYEFGFLPDGRIILIDEIHTPDSSRYWYADTYEARLSAGEEPDNADKEFIRLAYTQQGFHGEGEVPVLRDAFWLEVAKRYIDVYERLTQEKFIPASYPVADRLQNTSFIQAAQ